MEKGKNNCQAKAEEISDSLSVMVNFQIFGLQWIKQILFPFFNFVRNFKHLSLLFIIIIDMKYSTPFFLP